MWQGLCGNYLLNFLIFLSKINSFKVKNNTQQFIITKQIRLFYLPLVFYFFLFLLQLRQ